MGAGYPSKLFKPNFIGICLCTTTTQHNADNYRFISLFESVTTSVPTELKLLGLGTYMYMQFFQSQLKTSIFRLAFSCKEHLSTDSAVRLIFSKRRFESATPLLCDLHWLRVPQRVEYKLSVLVYHCLHNLAPEYFCDELRRVADIVARQQMR